MVEELFDTQNQIVNIILLAIALLLLMSFAIVLFFYFSRRKITKAELEKAKFEIDYQKDLLQATIVTQEEERKRIAQDLHDAISSKLNVVSLNANMLTDGEISSEETQKIGDSIHTITATVLENSRRIAHDLLPPTLEKFGLQAAVEELCEELTDTEKFELKHSIDYVEGSLKPEKELHVFRIIQELMNNTIKHSEAKTITLDLTSGENNLSLRYKDDGKGFQKENIKNAKGLGMSGIENRAVILEGDVQINSSPGEGIEVFLTTKTNHAN